MALVTYIKDTRYDSTLFRIERISNEERKQLNIKSYNGQDYIYIPKRKIVPKKIKLVKNRAYELTVKTRVWNDHIITTYYLDNTFQSLTYKHEPQFLFQNII